MNISNSIIGVDVGGTLTDFVVRDARGLRVLKVPSTPHDQSAAILDGLHRLGITGIVSIIHGSLVRDVRQTLIKDLRRRLQEAEQIALPFE